MEVTTSLDVALTAFPPSRYEVYQNLLPRGKEKYMGVCRCHMHSLIVCQYLQHTGDPLRWLTTCLPTRNSVHYTRSDAGDGSLYKESKKHKDLRNQEVFHNLFFHKNLTAVHLIFYQIQQFKMINWSLNLSCKTENALN